MYRCKAFIVVFCSLFLFIAADAREEFDENIHILEALMSIDNADHERAMAIYKKLYDKTGKKTYLKEALKFAFFTNSTKFDEIMGVAEKNLGSDSDFLRIKGARFMNQNRLEDAKEVMQKLVQTENKPRNHIMLGTILSMQNNNEEALKQYLIVYENDKSDENLLRVVEHLYEKLGRKDEAISYLETSRRIDGCSVPICLALIDIYIQDKKLNSAAEIYEELYKSTKDSEYLDKIVGIYAYEKNYDRAIEILQKYSHNDDLLIEIFALKGDLDSAYKKSKEIFEATKDVRYQARMAIYQYERDMKNLTDKSLEEVIFNFENSALKLDEAVYLNYYGYLLIDHDVDVKKGVNLVEKALLKEPNSVYYLDSLAWGLYKLGECKRADEIMSKTLHDSEFIGSTEAKEHMKAIKDCLLKEPNLGSKGVK